MKLLTKLNSAFDLALDLSAILAALLLLFMMLAVCAEILLRFLLNITLSWLLEISQACLLSITFLATAWVLKREGHVGLDAILSRLKPRTQAIVNTTTSILGAIMCLIVVWYGIKATYSDIQGGYRLTGEIMLPRGPLEAIIPVGSILLFTQFLRRIRGSVRNAMVLFDKE